MTVRNCGKVHANSSLLLVLRVASRATSRQGLGQLVLVEFVSGFLVVAEAYYLGMLQHFVQTWVG